MSIVWNDLFKPLLAGADPGTVWDDFKVKVNGWEAGINAKVPVAFQGVVSQLVSDVKQAGSDAISNTESALPTIVQDAAPIINDLFAKAATTYLGPGIGTAVSAAEADGLKRLEDWFIGQIKSAHLTQLAAQTGASAPPQQGT